MTLPRRGSGGEDELLCFPDVAAKMIESTRKRLNLSSLTTEELVQRFAELAAEHGDAIYHWDTSRANRIFPHIKALADELKSRENDKRTALLRLYDHPNVFVRLNAARYTLAVAPDTACRVLQTIAESKDYPASAEAGMSIHAFVTGINKPT